MECRTVGNGGDWGTRDRPHHHTGSSQQPPGAHWGHVLHVHTKQNPSSGRGREISPSLNVANHVFLICHEPNKIGLQARSVCSLFSKLPTKGQPLGGKEQSVIHSIIYSFNKDAVASIMCQETVLNTQGSGMS